MAEIICSDCGKNMGKTEKDWRKVLINMVENTPHLQEKKWEAKKSIRWMKNSGFPNWNQDEWPGFFFEFITGLQKHNYTGMAPFTYSPKGSNMVFDWIISNCPADLKTTSISENRKMSTLSNSLLNDQAAIRQALKEKGKLYYIILFGSRTLEKKRELKDWKETALAKKKSKYCLSGGTRAHRSLKLTFSPKRIILCEIDKNNLKYLNNFTQGNNSDFWTTDKTKEKAGRNPKYQFFKKNLSHFIIAELDLEPYQLRKTLK